MKNPKSITQCVSRFAGMTILATVFIVPLGYFCISYRYIAGILETEAEINGRLITGIINANPEMWEFQKLRMQEFLIRRPEKGDAEIRRVLNARNEVVAESVDPINPPFLIRSDSLMDSGEAVGRIEIFRSLRSLLMQTVAVIVLLLPAGLGVFLMLRNLPILKKSEEAARRLAQESAILVEIGRIISSTLNVEEVYGRFAEEMKKLIPFDQISVDLINPKNHTSTTAYVAGIDAAVLGTKGATPLTGTVTGQVCTTRSGFLFPLKEAGKELPDRYPDLLSWIRSGFCSLISVPLISNDEVIGVLHLRSVKKESYSERDLRIAGKVAGQISGVVANALLFNDMKRAEEEKEALREQLRQSQKMEAIGQLAGSIAHDFNNLLTIIDGYSQLSLSELAEPSPLRRKIEEILKATKRAGNLTRQILAFSRRQILDMKVLDLNTCVRDLNKMLDRLISEDIERITVLPENLGRVRTDPGQIEQVILNLAVNARDAMPDGGTLTVETANVELDEAYSHAHIAVTPGRYVMLAVSDTGVGMSPEVQRQVFEPFFTTKVKGKGTGLGLSTVYGIVKQSGGNIWVYSEPGYGSTFKIYLPRVDEPLERVVEKTVQKNKTFFGGETILVVEDDEEVRELTAQIIRKHGYKVLDTSLPDSALSICESNKGRIDLLVTDLVMPGMNGFALAYRLALLDPAMKVLYMSGYTDNAMVSQIALEQEMNFIQKPFSVEGLVEKIREVLDKSA